jgi:hypothetical protein
VLLQIVVSYNRVGSPEFDYSCGADKNWLNGFRAKARNRSVIGVCRMTRRAFCKWHFVTDAYLTLRTREAIMVPNAHKDTISVFARGTQKEDKARWKLIFKWGAYISWLTWQK